MLSGSQATISEYHSAQNIWRTKDEHRKLVSVARCRVSSTDAEGVVHAVTVDVRSLCEAVALAVIEFRRDALSETPAATEFTVSIPRQSVGAQNSIGSGRKNGRNENVMGRPGVLKRRKLGELLGKR